MPGPKRFREVFPGGEKAAGHARRVLAGWLADALPADRLGDMQLLVTEIVANCVRHGRVGEDGEIDLLVMLDGDVARVEVRDTGIQVDPRLTTPDLSGGGGFGMVLVERMSTAWGVDHEPAVVMWFELELGGEAGGAGRESARRRRPFGARTRAPHRVSRFRFELHARGLLSPGFAAAF
jgi:anti-sigma regulatory factor (Ser/Thr protein kinase)